MNLQDHINYVIDAHTHHSKKPSKAYRKWDGKTPYFIHPAWCAMTISTETELEQKTREEGILTLLYHDILEDTTKELPSELDSRIKYLVNEMTFSGGNEQEMKEIWSKPNEIKLYKLYDKVSNLLDASWMDAEKLKRYRDYTYGLAHEVEAQYGNLNIHKLANGLFSCSTFLG